MEISGFSGEALTPESDEFDNASLTWNHTIDYQPALIARCHSVNDVVAAINYAAQEEMNVAARCGGHSVSGASMPSGGIVVDLAGMKAINIDPGQRIAQVSGGVLLGELDAATQAHGLAVTAGVEPETGVGGLTLGGGIGFLSRKLGLTIDNLLGAQMVLADGSVVYTDENSHPDLFWAIRGGGGQFGIVTRFDFRVHPIGPDVVVSHAYYPLEKAYDVMRFVRDFMHDASDDVTLVPAFMKVPPADPFPAQWHGRPCVAVVACHVGEKSAAKEELRGLAQLGDMIFGFIDEMPYLEFQKTFAGASPKGGRYYWKSIFVEDLSDDLVEVMADGIETLGGEYTMIFMETLGGAVSKVGVEETAFPNRTARFNLGLSAGWVDESQDETIICESREWFERLKPFSDGTVYFNYLDRDEAARTQVAFGPNYERLREIKARYDPQGLFAGPLLQR